LTPEGALVEEAELKVIGMISGTSFDAVEALLVELELDSEVLVCDLVEHHSVPYPSATHDAIAALLPPSAATIEQVCRLDVEIGQFFAAVAHDLVDRHGPVDVVCSHGQTVYHWVEGNVARGTLQLGEPAWIAELTGAAVVSDVRNRDIACGGHGAPLASLLDVLLLGSHPSATSGSLNLGGIANVTVVGPERPPIAFDIGPANALMDVVVQVLSEGQESFDRDGAIAAQGHPDKYLVDRLLDDPYFSLPPPKSTGKEYFNYLYVADRLPEGRDLNAADLLASVTAASAEMVAMALRPFHLRELVVAGGGTRNPTLMGELEARLAGVPMRKIDDLGVPEAAKEALVFAVIGFLTLCGIPATIPSCTGSSKPSVLGSITPGARTLPLPPALAEGARVTPTRLVVRTPLPAR
jgi:anhydro-N-acetylmuramic acid kinase